MRRILWLPAVLFVLGACATTPPPGEDPPEPLPGDRTSVTVLAEELGLASSYDARRNRITLAGPKGTVVLYPGTNVALVNGTRVGGMGRVERYGGAWALAGPDATRIRRELTRPLRPPREERGAAKALEPVAAPPGPVPDRGWSVHLGRQWRYIVIHHSGTKSGNAARFGLHHRRDNGWDGLGYHFVIGNGHGSRDGQVEIGYRWTRQKTGAHAGRAPNGSNLMNERGIGICLVGDFNKTRPTKKQIASLHRLVDWLSKRCGIPPDHVLLHRDVRDTECPGRYFPVEKFLARHRSVPVAFRQN